MTTIEENERYEATKKKRREDMAADRKARPEIFKARDMAKHKKLMENEATAFKERDRQRKKEQRKRDMLKQDKCLHEAWLAAERKRHALRRGPGGDEEPTEENLAKRRKKYNKHNPVCTVCIVSHCSKVYDDCHSCRRHKKYVNHQENEVLNFFEKHEMFPSLTNKKGPCVVDTTNRRRADMLFFAGNDKNNVVILEVDENEHKHYPVECEVARMSDIRDQYTGRHIICIRYNPCLKKFEDNVAQASAVEIIREESKKEAFMAVRAALDEPLVVSEMGYTLRYIGYNDSRIKELSSAHSKMQTEAMSVFTQVKEKSRKEKNV